MNNLANRLGPNAPAQPASAPREADARSVLTVLCGCWTSTILQALEGGALRSNELARTLLITSRKTLTQSLRRLESLGLLERHIFAEVPARVEYSLTPLGCAFIEPVRTLSEWARAHPEELQAVIDASPPLGALPAASE